MVELQAKSPLDGMAPLTLGHTTLREVAPGHLTTLAPFAGCAGALSEDLERAHGMAAPAPNRATGREGARAIWFGRDLILLAGPAPDPSLARNAALADQTDAWACVRLEGRDARAVLARLTPIDLRPGVFKRGHTARTDLQHMPASLTQVGDSAYQIMVFRAFGATLVHDLRTAMNGVAARAGP
ncbi:sarcosine oxidase subunit gamma [Roseovarius salis]|uniref:sarcosine oxidase subunit gamma n=1 Tax=Roseovarius salis TaxID=3376063 RepID=UPI0037C58F64